MKLTQRHYYRGDSEVGIWRGIEMANSVTARRVAVIALTAVGCTRARLQAALQISAPTATRDLQYLQGLDPDFGTDKWRLAYLEQLADNLRRKIERDEALRN